ncbi:antitoxin CptB [Pantoea dispersa]|nr:antitoxin CptB [Pantoea dispersa]
MTKRASSGHAVAACWSWMSRSCRFFKYEYDSLSDSDKQVFVALLKSDDPDLFNWMMNHGEPADPEFKRMVKLIQQRNRERGPVAM